MKQSLTNYFDGIGMESAHIKERPMLFSSEMVKAIIQNRKSQTRRVLRPQPFQASTGSWFWSSGDNHHVWSDHPFPHIHLDCPYGSPGDRLWVRETFCIDHFEYLGKLKGLPPPGRSHIYYAADGEDLCSQIPECDCSDGCIPWRPSIHMPRWASRLDLEIKSIRVERLQDITEAEIAAEGFFKQDNLWCVTENFPASNNPLYAWELYWNLLNSERGYPWAANPWGWVIEFRKL